MKSKKKVKEEKKEKEQEEVVEETEDSGFGYSDWDYFVDNIFD